LIGLHCFSSVDTDVDLAWLLTYYRFFTLS